MARASVFHLILGLFCAAALANPPAPSFTIYGCVRGEDGRPLLAGEGTVIISTAAGEVARGPIDTTLGKGINYTLHLPMDSFTTAALYKPTASDANVPFTVQVLIDGVAYVPIAVAGRTLDTNEPAVRERFDFVLGIDSDGDGLPDAWERGLIESGHHGGLLTTIDDVNPNDDSDHDGISNLDEFLLGTYALDGNETLFLEILGMENGIAHLRFIAARGRTYSISTSVDLRNWSAIPFSLNSSGANAGGHYVATDSDYLDVYVPGIPALPGQPSQFFKLHVD